VLGIGFLYASLFNAPVDEFIPFVALGLVFFGAISGVLTEGCQTFLNAAGMLSQTSLPMFTFVWRTVLRNLIYLGHHVIIVVAVLVWFDAWRGADPLLAAAGLGLLVVNVAWASLLVGIASARFRDVPQVVISIVQFAMFITPVFWRPHDRFEHDDAVLAPLLGETVHALTWWALIAMALIGWAVTFGLFATTRRRIVHYL
jgi:ABC-type polysaccharide/polyol phosphate export permease